MTEKRGRGRPPKAETVVARQAVAQYQQAQNPAPYQQAVMVMRNKLAVHNKASYDAGGTGRFLASWKPTNSGPNTSHENIQLIRSRSRDAGRNEWAGASTTQKWSTTLIGIGITPRFKRLTDEARKLVVTDLYNDFVKESDADGVLNLYGQQTLVVTGWFEAGEIFARRRDRPFDDQLAVPMQVQLLESEMCPDFTADSLDDRLPMNNRIVRGIEINKRGKRVAYWFYKEHPSDGKYGPSSSMIPTSDALVRVLASEVCHVFKPSRPGQMRGVPAMVSVLPRMRSISDYDGNVLTRMQLSNLFMAFVKQTITEMVPDDTINGGQGITGATADGSIGGAPIIGMQPGATGYLGPGEEVQFSNPPEAGPDYSAYMRTQHMGTAAATGLPYELMSGDIQNVSDRTLRVVINEFRRLSEQHQWQIIIPMFCEKVMKWLGEAAVLAGKISLEEADAVARAEHQPHGWAYIHPVQDPQGKKLEVDAGFRSRSSVIAERGDDPSQVDQERQDDDEREQEMAIGPYSDAAALENAPAGGVLDDEPPDDSTPPTSMLDARLAARADEEINLLRAQVHRLQNPPKPPEDPNAAARSALLARMITILDPAPVVQ